MDAEYQSESFHNRHRILVAIFHLAFLLIATMSFAGAASNDRKSASVEIRRARAAVLAQAPKLTPPALEIAALMPNAEVIWLIAATASQRPQESEATLRGALALLKTEAEQKHRWGLHVLLNDALWVQGKRSEAREEAQKAYEIAVGEYPADSVAVYYTSVCLATLFEFDDRPDDAFSLALKAHEILRKTAHTRKPEFVMLNRIDLGRLWVKMDQPQYGAELVREVVADKLFDKLSPYSRARVLGDLATINYADKHYDQAIRHLEAALLSWDLVETKNQWDRQEIAMARLHLGELLGPY